MDTNAMDASGNSGWSIGDVSTISDVDAHGPLHRFITSLLDEALVSALHTFLFQDNASILAKSASRSAHATHKRFVLDRDHLITKEISWWESYPFQVDTPIMVQKQKKVKNGCVSQRRAKRRSGMESLGEIKADIMKKMDSLLKAPRRRSSVRTDDSLKANMQEELISRFKTVATPKMPIRRVSELPEDLTAIYHNPSKARAASLDSLDSQHSIASVESTLSKIAARHSDLSTISENSGLAPSYRRRKTNRIIVTVQLLHPRSADGQKATAKAKGFQGNQRGE